MKLRPWIERHSTPGGEIRDTLVGIRAEITWLEARAFFRKVFRRRKGTRFGIPAPVHGLTVPTEAEKARHRARVSRVPMRRSTPGRPCGECD